MNRERDRERQREREKETDRDRERERKRHREIERHRETQRETEGDIEREIVPLSLCERDCLSTDPNSKPSSTSSSHQTSRRHSNHRYDTLAASFGKCQQVSWTGIAPRNRDVLVG